MLQYFDKNYKKYSIKYIKSNNIGEFITHKFVGIKIAYVDRNLSDVELNKFGETDAINRGAFGRVFNNIIDAEKWLKH
jgi:hypothetical protein